MASRIAVSAIAVGAITTDVGSPAAAAHLDSTGGCSSRAATARRVKSRHAAMRRSAVRTTRTD